MPRPKKQASESETSKENKKRTKKDPNAPKKPNSAYIMFTKSERPKLTASKPNLGPTEVMKELGRLWGELSPSEKVKFEKEAAADKERYQEEMEEYSPPPKEEAAKASRKTKKDPNAPKRGMSAYIIFSQAESKKIREANPSMTVTQVMREAASRWAKLDQAGRKPFEAKAVKDKQRYEKEIAAYKSAKDEEEDQEEEEEEEEEDADSS